MVNLDEAVNQVDVRFRVAQPRDVVVVPVREAAAAIERDELRERGALRIVLGYGRGLLEPADHALDGLRVPPADLLHVLDRRAVALHEPRVQPERHAASRRRASARLA